MILILHVLTGFFGGESDDFEYWLKITCLEFSLAKLGSHLVSLHSFWPIFGLKAAFMLKSLSEKNQVYFIH